MSFAGAVVVDQIAADGVRQFLRGRATELNFHFQNLKYLQIISGRHSVRPSASRSSCSHSFSQVVGSNRFALSSWLVADERAKISYCLVSLVSYLGNSSFCFTMNTKALCWLSHLAFQPGNPTARWQQQTTIWREFFSLKKIYNLITLDQSEFPGSCWMCILRITSWVGSDCPKRKYEMIMVSVRLSVLQALSACLAEYVRTLLLVLFNFLSNHFV